MDWVLKKVSDNWRLIEEEHVFFYITLLPPFSRRRVLNFAWPFLYMCWQCCANITLLPCHFCTNLWPPSVSTATSLFPYFSFFSFFLLYYFLIYFNGC